EVLGPEVRPVGRRVLRDEDVEPTQRASEGRAAETHGPLEVPRHEDVAAPVNGYSVRRVCGARPPAPPRPKVSTRRRILRHEDIGGADAGQRAAPEVHRIREGSRHDDIAAGVHGYRFRLIVTRAPEASRPQMSPASRILGHDDVVGAGSGERPATEVDGAREVPRHHGVAAAVNRHPRPAVEARGPELPGPSVLTAASRWALWRVTAERRYH